MNMSLYFDSLTKQVDLDRHLIKLAKEDIKTEIQEEQNLIEPSARISEEEVDNQVESQYLETNPKIDKKTL